MLLGQFLDNDRYGVTTNVEVDPHEPHPLSGGGPTACRLGRTLCALGAICAKARDSQTKAQSAVPPVWAAVPVAPFAHACPLTKRGYLYHTGPVEICQLFSPEFFGRSRKRA